MLALFSKRIAATALVFVVGLFVASGVWAGTISGTISYDSSGVEHVIVYVYSVNGEMITAYAETDSSGAYSITDAAIVANSNYYLKLYPRTGDYIMRKLTGIHTNSSGIATGSTALSIGASTISGTVSHALTGTTVSFYNFANDMGYNVLTTSGGSYALGNLMSGAAALQVEPDYTSGYAYGFKNIDLASDVDLTNFNIILKQGALISGDVKVGSEGQEHVSVNLDGARGASWNRTDDDGKFEMRIPPGTYLLSVTPPMLQSETWGWGIVATPQTITVTSTANDQTIHMIAYDASDEDSIAKISGTVTNLSSPSPGAMVMAIAFKKDTLKNASIATAEDMIAIATAAVNPGTGAYELRVPPNSDCDVCIVVMSSSNGIRSFVSRDVALGVVVPAGGGTVTKNFDYGTVSGGTVSGTVKLDGNSAVMARVILYNASGQFVGTADTGTGGAYTFSNVVAGNYTVRAMMPYSEGLSSGSASIIVPSSGSVDAGTLRMSSERFNNVYNPADLVGNGSQALSYNFGTDAGQGYWAFENNATWMQIQYTDTTDLTFAASADLDGNGFKDLIFNFGTDAGKGFWAFENNATWKRIDYTDTADVTFKGASDLDGNGSKDLVFNFGTDAGKGYWAYENNSTWKQIQYTDTADVSLTTATDLDGNGAQDLIFNFGDTAGKGFWAFENNTTWKQIEYTDRSDVNVSFMAASDLDGNGSQDLVFSFGTDAGQGYWAYENNTIWKKIDYTDASGVTLMAAADLDGNGSKDLVFNFGTDAGQGYWAYENNSTWKKIEYTDTTGITLQAATDVDGNGSQDLVFNFGTALGQGYWIFANNSTWMQIQYTDTTGVTLMAATDLDGNGSKDLVFDFGTDAGQGYWAYENNSTWKKIEYTDTTGITLQAVADLDGNGSKDLVFNFGTNVGEGCWAFENNATWKKIDYTDTKGIILPEGDTDAIARMDFESGLNPQGNASYYRMKGDMVIKPNEIF